MKASEAWANAPTGPRKARPDDKLRAAPTRSFTEADQLIAAAVGERKREEKRSTFDLEPPVAGHRSFPNALVSTALHAFAHPPLVASILPWLILQDPADNATSENVPMQGLCLLNT